MLGGTTLRSQEAVFRPIIDLRIKMSASYLCESCRGSCARCAQAGAHVPLSHVRRSVDYLKSRLGSKHPLAEQKFATEALTCSWSYSAALNITREGQLVIKELIEAYLRRVERDPVGIPVGLPIHPGAWPEEPRPSS